MKGGIIGSACFLACLIVLPNYVYSHEISSIPKLSDKNPIPAANSELSNRLFLSRDETRKLLASKDNHKIYKPVEHPTHIADPAQNLTADGNKSDRRSGLPVAEEVHADEVSNVHQDDVKVQPDDKITSQGGERSLNSDIIMQNSAYNNIDLQSTYVERIVSLLDPSTIFGNHDTITCLAAGDMHYLRLHTDCYICACIADYQYGLVAKCALCNGCSSPQPLPIPTIMPTTVRPTIPTLPPQPSCYPFQEGEMFENPLNPCQICVCYKIINTEGRPDIQIFCEANPDCVTTTTHAPTRSLPPWSTSTPTVYPTPSTTQRPPHSSCAPYTSNVPYTNPEDDCEVCVCREYKDTWATEVETVCKTRPECCVLPPPERNTTYIDGVCKYHPLNEPFLVQGFLCKKFVCRMANNQVYAELIDDPNCDVNQLIKPDQICRQYGIGVEFVSRSEKCKVCRCEIFGSLIVPICRKQPGCNDIVPVVPSGGIVYIAPFCRSQPPNMDFDVGCSSCQCSLIYNFVIANCIPRPGCDSNSGSGYIGSMDSNSFNAASAGFGAFSGQIPIKGNSEILISDYSINHNGVDVHRGGGAVGSMSLWNSNGFRPQEYNHHQQQPFAANSGISANGQGLYGLSGYKLENADVSAISGNDAIAHAQAHALAQAQVQAQAQANALAHAQIQAHAQSQVRTNAQTELNQVKQYINPGFIHFDKTGENHDLEHVDVKATAQAQAQDVSGNHEKLEIKSGRSSAY